MDDADGLVITVEEAAARYAEAKRARDTAVSEMERMKEVLERVLGSEHGDVPAGEWLVRYQPGAVRRKPNAADLIADGYSPEEFGSFTPSMTKLRSMAKRLGWSDTQMEGYLLDGEPGAPRVTVVRNYAEELELP